jgi:hypothetical protein
MNSNRMLMGAAIVGCLTAAGTPGAYAQEANSTTQLRAGHPVTGSIRSNGSMQESSGANLNARPDVRMNAQTERHAPSRMREGRGYAEQHAMRGERGSYAGVEGAYREHRVGYRYRDRTFHAGVGVADEDYGNRTRRLYAYAPTYTTGYATAPRYNYRYSYAPGYDVSVNAAPYYSYSPGWSVAYADPYYGYGPGAGIGIGIGPVGIGIGPAWGW